MFQRGSSFIFLFRNRETEPWKLIKIPSLTWEGKTSSKNFSREKWSGVRDSRLCHSQQHPPAQKDSFTGKFHLAWLVFWEVKLPNRSILLFLHWIFWVFPQEAEKSEKQRKEPCRNSIHSSFLSSLCNQALPYFQRRHKGHLISWKEGLMSQKMNELSASADNPWENSTRNVDLV